MAVKSAKQILRREIKRRISQLSEDEKLRQSRIVCEKMPEYKRSDRISVYLSMNDEIRTNDILNDLFESKKQCFIPHYFGSNMDMVKLYSMKDYNSLPETAWKIKQPADPDKRENAIDTGGLDLILVPGLGFTKSGDRLGRGKGYYDTYLEKYMKHFNKKPTTIALAFYEQICETIPTTEHDVSIDFVLFEEKSEN